MSGDWSDRVDTLWRVYILGLVAWAAISVGAYCLLGCSRELRLPAAQQSIPVSVISWPSPIRPTCELSSLPPLPDINLYEKPDAEATGRYFITARQLAELLAFLRDVKHWGDLHEKCLRLLTVPH